MGKCILGHTRIPTYLLIKELKKEKGKIKSASHGNLKVGPWQNGSSDHENNALSA